MGFESADYTEKLPLPAGWRSLPLAQCIERIIDYRGKTPPKSPFGIPCLTAANVKSGRIDLTGVSYISEATYSRVATRGFPNPGDVLLTTEAPVGEVAEFPGDRTYHITRRVIAIRADERQLVGKYLLYALQGGAIRQLLRSRIRGSTVERILKEDITRLPIALPPLPEQRAIAHILSTLDNKIDLNRRMNETLEAMVRALFQSWFVDFDPVRANAEGRQPPGMDSAIASLFPGEFQDSELGPIPKRWQPGRLGDVASQVREAALPHELPADTPYIGLEHMPQRSIALATWGYAAEVQSQKSRFYEGQILFGKLRPYFHKVGVAPVDGVCSTDVVVIEVRHDDFFSFCVGHVSSDAFVAYANAGSDGTKMPRTSWKQMATYACILPPEKVAYAFDTLCRPWLSRIRANIFESRTLVALRDALLPRLLSGELSVGKAMKAMEAVA